MPQKGAVDAPRFSGSLDDLLRCPTVRYSKHNLYDLIDEQKTVKIDSYEALLNYQLHFTKVVAHLRVTSQLLSIKKDVLFLEGFDQEFQRLFEALKSARRNLKKPGSQNAQDEPRTDERPIEAVVLTLKVLKPTPEPRDDLHEVPEQAGCTKVEEIKSEVKVERQSKVVAQRKPPEVKGLDSFIDIFAAGMDSESQCRDAHNKSKHAYLSYKSENYLFEGYEILGGKVKAPHSGGWSTNLESMVTSSTRKLTEKDASRVRTPQAIWSATSSIQGYEAGDRAKAKPRAPPGTWDKTQSAQRFSRRATSMRPPQGLFVYSSGCSWSLLEDTPWSAFMKPQQDNQSSKNPFEG
ncbi:hypothetical protein EV401DRAFT_1888670 [Pisolithus croceorrhizus]|nr:hypothetical protein EV401DRAFT_1888670 [Pisolithus croceorrhizus]